MLVKVHRDGKVEGKYFQNLWQAEKKNMERYAARRELESEEFIEKVLQAQKIGFWPNESPKIKPRRKKNRNKYSPEEKKQKIIEILQMRKKGLRWATITRKTGVPKNTASKWMREWRQKNGA